MKLIIIAALTKDRVIGKRGRIPWHLPDDLKRFKELTMGHTVLMGRKTYESLGRALPGRRNVVLTSRQISGVETYASLEEALEALNDEGKVFVVGGGRVFAQLLEAADELRLTIVEQKVVEGDTFFPPYDEMVARDFKEVGRENHEGYVSVHYVRLNG